MKPGTAMVSALHCYATAPRFDPGARQGCLSLSSLKLVDEMSTKFAWELNTGDPVSG